MDDVNYIPYFTDIEDTFIRLREKSLFLSPADWALMESWKERGIPLHVVLASIEEVFKNHKSKARRRGINSLRYCQAEVDAQFAEYCNAMVGSHEEQGSGARGQRSDDPFSKENVLAHLQAVTEKLLRAQPGAPESLQTAIGKVCGTLITWGLDFSHNGNVRELEEALTKMDDDLRGAIHVAATSDQVMECREKAGAALAGYSRNMSDDAYQQTFSTLLNNHLRGLFSVPRLSLFHMK